MRFQDLINKRVAVKTLGQGHGVERGCKIGGALAPQFFGVAHGLGGYVCGAAGLGWCGQLGPDVLPVVWAQFLQHKRSVNFVKFAGQARTSHLQTFADLIQVLLVNIDLLGDFAPTLGGVIWYRHAANSSLSLAFVKPGARKCF